ncbi:heavy metal translocating P-type ATPase [Erysipelothrix anatis]|uniref:heavy metal translocating P-type ATPase n=1 Tax=Erysipelothrix anatis TaxID=2683713 RepID=UPI00140BB504|nr:heavy metal translocating P-type ATPase [Erysipelothrix anatis]
MHFDKKWLPFALALVLRISAADTFIAQSIFGMVGIFYASYFSIQSFRNLRYRIVGIDLLVTLAALGSLFIGEPWEAASVTFLYVFGKHLESRALYKTQTELKSLIDSMPTTVVGADGMTYMMDEVFPGMDIKVVAGNVIPVDGSVYEGIGSVDEASITGESNLQQKTVASQVFMGSILKEGYLLIRVERTSDDTVYGQILDLVENAQNKKSRVQNFIDRFSQYYTPAVIGIAIVAYLLTQDIRMALSLLVVSCPGALVIAIPIASSVALSHALKHHVLIKGIDIFEKLNKIETIAFDKTGTLTLNTLSVVRVEAHAQSQERVLQIAASLEHFSEHVIASAILDRNTLPLKEVSDFEVIAGMGVTGTIDGVYYRVGQENLFSYDVPLVSSSAVYVGTETELYGIVVLEDTLRPEAPDALDQLQDYTLMMLTGDNAQSAQRIADMVNISHVESRLLPQEKLDIINHHDNIMMVGDGMNDSPSLIAADLGVSMGGSENRVAMECADMILAHRDLNQLPKMFRLARRVRNVMYQNIVIALVTVAVLFIGVLNAHVSMSLGMVIHELSVLIVIVNAMRLRG